MRLHSSKIQNDLQQTLTGNWNESDAQLLSSAVLSRSKSTQ